MSRGDPQMVFHHVKSVATTGLPPQDPGLSIFNLFWVLLELGFEDNSVMNRCNELGRR